MCMLCARPEHDPLQKSNKEYRKLETIREVLTLAVLKYFLYICVVNRKIARATKNNKYGKFHGDIIVLVGGCGCLSCFMAPVERLCKRRFHPNRYR